MTPSQRSLHDVLRAAQRAGSLGARPIEDVIDHARHFVRALPDDVASVIDIGSGAGIPGLVVAVDRPDVMVTMVDRRATRMDALTRSVEAMGLGSRVRVITADAEDLGHDPDHAASYDAAVCRGLGNPEYTATLARPFLAERGVLVVSEPPDPSIDRWPPTLFRPLGFHSVSHHGAVVVLSA